MKDRSWRWVSLGMAVVGALSMLAGVAILAIQHDEGQALSWLFIGGVIFGTSGIGSRQRRCWPRRGLGAGSR